MSRPTNRRELIDLHRQGYSNRRIALICGMSHGSVGRHINEWLNTGVEDAPIYSAPPSVAEPVEPARSEAKQHRLDMETASNALLRRMAEAFQRGEHLRRAA